MPTNRDDYYEALDMYGGDMVTCCICGTEIELRYTGDMEGEWGWHFACVSHFKHFLNEDVFTRCPVPWRTLPLPLRA